MHRQQVHRLCLPIAQQPLPILTPPRKHLVGIHAVRPRHLGHRRPRLKRLFDDPPLLRNRAPPARLSLNDYPLRSVHLFPKWTLPDVPTWAIIPHFSHFSQSARTGRLRFTQVTSKWSRARVQATYSKWRSVLYISSRSLSSVTV